jgi:hypothetical protein
MKKMKTISERFYSGYLLIGVAILNLLGMQSAQAVPSFANQTGQSCVACHAGGQYPELTPYGRMFKLTGYTMGERSNPLAAMVVASRTSTKNSDGSTLNGRAIVDFASVFLAGKVTDNIGGFAQYTQSFYDTQDPNNNWAGHFAADNFDLRYADRQIDTKNDVVWGLTLHNNPSVQDVWNTSPAWGYPYVSTTHGAFGGLPAATLVEGALAQQVAGMGGYAFLNKSVYAEITSYQTAKGSTSFLSYGSKTGDSNHPLTLLDGNALYWRLAYTHEWGAQNIMLGAFGLNARTFPNDSASNMPVTDAGSTHFKDIGIDAQYQYLMSPHTFTGNFRAVHETINDASLTAYAAPASLNTLMVKASYVYREKYGGSLVYKTVTGSADASAYSFSALNVPDASMWTTELFWIPLQNVRLGIQYSWFTKYAGASSNYDGSGRNASDNATTYLYLWTAF